MRSIWNENSSLSWFTRQNFGDANAIFLYPLCILLAISFYLFTDFTYRHPDSSYLRARYAQNLRNGEGFVYNPDERLLLTSAPLMVLAQAVISLNEITRPPELLTVVVMGIAAAGLMRLFQREKIPLVLGAGLTLVWLSACWLTFGGVEIWLAALSLTVIDFAASERWRPAGLAAGFTLLVAPLALIFVFLLGIRAERRFWIPVCVPALVWWGFAAWYFGRDGLRGLTLPAAPGDGFLGMLSLLILIPLGFWIVLTLRKLPSFALIMVIWSLSYSLFAVLFNLTDDATLLVCAGVILAGFAFKSTDMQIVRAANIGLIILLVGLIAFHHETPENTRAVESLPGSVGHFGSNQEAFFLGGAVYQLDGERDPHLRELVDDGDAVGVLIATAPDVVFYPGALPDDPALNLLGYAENSAFWERGVPVYAWQTPQSVNIHFGSDILLRNVASDRNQTHPGDILRLRLDWELLRGKHLENRLLFLFNVLDYQQANYGSIQQAFPARKWEASQTTTYHVIPLNSDAPPGRYTILLAIDYDGGIVDQHIVGTIKVPAPTDVVFTEPPLAEFSDGVQSAELMQAQIQQTENQILVNLVWRARGGFNADYSIFVHLTPPDDFNPLAQADSPPMSGRYPTTLWDSGEVIQDTHTFDLSDVPDGDYVIRVGFFHPERGRIPADEGDSVIVGSVSIE